MYHAERLNNCYQFSDYKITFKNSQCTHKFKRLYSILKSNFKAGVKDFYGNEMSFIIQMI